MIRSTRFPHRLYWTACLFSAALGWQLLRANVCRAEPPATWRPLTSDGAFKQRPAFSPDGKWMVFTGHTENSAYLFLVDRQDGGQRRLTQREQFEYDAAFSPDGSELAFTMDKASPNQGDMDVCRMPFAGEGLSVVAASDGKLSHEEYPTWSPDGKWLAFTSTSEGNQEVYLARPDGSERRRLTTSPGLDMHPCWAPDGKQIAICTDRWGDLEIAVIEVSSGQVRRLTESPGLDDYPAWSPDGKQLAFTSNREGNLEIFVGDAGGGNASNLSRHPAVDNFAAWTPAGELAFVSNRHGGFEIYIGRPGN